MSGPVDHDKDASALPLSEEEILQALLHGSFPKRESANDSTLPAPEEDGSRSRKKMEFAEHVQLGDPVRLSWHDDTPQLAKSKPFKLDNGLRLTYGQICALGGDFFGYKEPICFGKTFEDQITRFTKGFETLATGTAAKALAEKVLKSKEEEVAAVEAASQPGSKATTDAYYNSIRAKYIVEIQNILGGVFGGQEKGYLGLSLLNLDHFGADARTAYNAGHTAALRRAAKDKTAKGLEEAYAMNAFADHYLQDSFASGHMRVPRRKLCAGVSGDLNYARDVCAHAMHREDNKEGLVVKNPLGQSWRAYGDSALFSPPNRDNLARCRDAVAASANEVYEAWQKQTIPPVSSFKAWQHAPTLESALDPANKNHPPMFNKEGCPRTDVLDKTCKTYESPNGMFWSYLNTARKLLTSGH